MEIAPGVYSLRQSKGFDVHAFLLDDGAELSLIDTLFDPDAKVIMLSMIGEENSVFEAIQSGACDYLRKPLNPDFFAHIIKKQLARTLEINKKVEGNHAAVKTKFEESYAF